MSDQNKMLNISRNLITFLFFLLIINDAQCIYILPLRTSTDYNGKSLDTSKAFHNLIVNNIYTELDIGNPTQKLATYVRTKDYCSYIASNLCNVKGSNYESLESTDFENVTDYVLTYKEFNNVCLANEKINLFKKIDDYSSKKNLSLDKFYHAPYNPYSEEKNMTCGVFGFKFQSDSEVGDNDCISFLDNILYNNAEDENYNSTLFSIQYFTEEEKEDKEVNYDGRLVIGDYPHNFDSEHYNESNYTKIYMNDSAIETTNDYHLIFSEVFYYKNNKESNTSKVSFTDPEILEGAFVIEQNVITVPSIFYNSIKEDFFNTYISSGDCEETLIDNQYQSFFCYKERISTSSSFESTFPQISFVQDDLKFTFVFKYGDLFKELDGKIYFMLCLDNNNLNTWGLGKLLMEKYLFTFNMEEKSVGFYNEKMNPNYEFDFLDSGIYVLIILGANILVMLSFFFYFLFVKCCKSSYDPTIMIDVPEDNPQKETSNDIYNE